MAEQVVLVDDKDNEIGLMEKIEAHRKALLHRAFSVFVMNDAGEIMMQQRAHEKYHSGGLWTNTCCSHPRQGESAEEAAHRRLQEEMGFDCPVEKLFEFVYKAEFDNGLTEHEYDHLFVGHYNGVPKLNPDEAAAWKWMTADEVERDLVLNPQDYTAWFKIIFERFRQNIPAPK